MGLLSLGTPEPWHVARSHAAHIQRHGIVQYLAAYHSLKHRSRDALLWGEEIEYMIVAIDDAARRAVLALKADEVLPGLEQEEREAEAANANAAGGGGEQAVVVQTAWRPEYARYMLEGTPGAPYDGGSLRALLNVEPNMRLRRQLAKEALGRDEFPVTLTSFPRLGAPGVFTRPYFPPGGAAAESLYVPDEIIFPHPRFPTMTANIRARRGEKVAINVPVFYDTNTPAPFIDPTVPAEEYDQGAAIPGHVHMDAQCFGMGCCCLQITFQACNIDEARWVYDQLVPLAPIMLALTAASPLYKGYVTDVDCRWGVIAASVDDRTREERGLVPQRESKYVIGKSRYDSVDCYISQDPRHKPEYNDVQVTVNEEALATLVEGGVDPILARHIAHLFIRDPIVVYEELIHQDDAASMDHFENIQSTNWQTVRFKPPPVNSPIGWRVEFRPMEVQLTDFENAAFATFMVLVTRVILSYKLCLYMQISKVEENMRRGVRRGAAASEKFWFRRQIFAAGDAEAAEYTINEIINGTPPRTADDAETSFPGLIPLINSYLDMVNVDVETRCTLNRYLRLISRRASGELMTTATWMRAFVRSHEAYTGDSCVGEDVTFDLMRVVVDIGEGKLRIPELAGAQ